jgi:hypothetical protein
MALGSTRRSPPPVRIRGEVFAVGRRVYVTSKGDPSARAILMDEPDKTSLGTVDDGVEVTILAWRPGWAGRTRYRVRSILSGVEGWLLEAHLRSSQSFVPVATATLPVEDSIGSGRRFGESAHRS